MDHGTAELSSAADGAKALHGHRGFDCTLYARRVAAGNSVGAYHWRKMTRDIWTCSREWPRETVFVIAGGPSVLSVDLECLRGRHVIVINSSVYAVPWADFLYFGDWRWWNEPDNKAAVAGFAGRVITTSQMVTDKKVLCCWKTNPPGLALACNSLMQKWTSLTAATNLAMHLVGPGGTIVWIGADGKRGADGRTHHHKPHRFGVRADAYPKQHLDLVTVRPSLERRSIRLLNASPETAWSDLCPVISLTDFMSTDCGDLATTSIPVRSFELQPQNVMSG